jgi:hypothetical protein
MGDFLNAADGLSVDQFLLGFAYVTAVNDESTQIVSVVQREESFEEGTATLLNYANPLMLDQYSGGGRNKLVNSNTTLSVIISDSQAKINDYMQDNGKYMARLNSAGELLAHEMLGHGFNRTGGGSLTDSHKDPIQMTNLYLRSQNIKDIYRDGRAHGSSIDVNLPKQQATGVPEAYQRAIGVYKLMKFFK